MHQQVSSRRAPRYGLVVALLTLGFAVIGLAPAHAKSSTPTPFKSSITGTVTSTGPNAFDLAGSGRATMLGHTGDAGMVHVTNTDSNGVLTDTLTETLTAATGDTLTLVCQQTAAPLRPGVYHGTDTWSVVGGTGRFANASGSGTGSTDVDLNVGTFSKTASGSIAFG